MIQVQIKVGRDFIWVDDHDVIMDNGSCIQMLTNTKWDHSTWSNVPRKISKKLFNDLRGRNLLYTNETIQNQYQRKLYGINIPCTYYKFHIEKMAVAGYETREG